ncbi:MAG: MaoC family dehydratase [Novosphingobium sp.]
MAGRYFDQWSVGDKLTHQPGRTVTETDNLMFSALTHNMQPLHLDAEYARASEFGQILVNSTFTFSLATGLSIADTTVGTLIANLGFDKVVTPRPVFIGDTLTCHTEVLEKRESRSRPTAGIVVFRHSMTNQRAEEVISFTRTVLLHKAPA